MSGLHHGDERLQIGHRSLRAVVQVPHGVAADHLAAQLTALHVTEIPRVLQRADAETAAEVHLQADAAVDARPVQLATPTALCEISTLQHPAQCLHAAILSVHQGQRGLSQVRPAAGTGPTDLRILRTEVITTSMPFLLSFSGEFPASSPLESLHKQLIALKTTKIISLSSWREYITSSDF